MPGWIINTLLTVNGQFVCKHVPILDSRGCQFLYYANVIIGSELLTIDLLNSGIRNAFELQSIKINYKKGNMKYKLLTAASASLLAILPVKANLVVNGDFESHSGAAAANWTVSNPPVNDTSGFGVGGSFGEVFGPGRSKITQDVDLGPNPPGKNPEVEYQITFYAMNLVTDQSTFVPDGEFDIKLDGRPDVMVSVSSGTDLSAYSEYTVDITTSDLGLRPLSITWTGTADTGSTAHGNLVTHGEGLLDDVTVTAVPEASTVIAGLLLLLPFGASTLRILRKR